MSSGNDILANIWNFSINSIRSIDGIIDFFNSFQIFRCGKTVYNKFTALHFPNNTISPCGEVFLNDFDASICVPIPDNQAAFGDIDNFILLNKLSQNVFFDF